MVKEAKIGRAVMDADVFISLTHFKGHEEAGFGGALKNIGMGCGSRAGKMEQHNAGKPHVDHEALRGLRDVYQDLRPQRPVRCGAEGQHRPQPLRGLRPLHRHLSPERHPDRLGRDRRRI